MPERSACLAGGYRCRARPGRHHAGRGGPALHPDHLLAAHGAWRDRHHTGLWPRPAPAGPQPHPWSHFFIYDGANDGAYAPKARAFVRQLARYGVPSYWDSRVTEPTGILYHTWTYWREGARDALIRLSALFLTERAQSD